MLKCCAILVQLHAQLPQSSTHAQIGLYPIATRQVAIEKIGTYSFYYASTQGRIGQFLPSSKNTKCLLKLLDKEHKNAATEYIN